MELRNALAQFNANNAMLFSMITDINEHGASQ